MTPQPPQPQQPSSLPIVAFVLACIGVCVPLFGCVGFVLGIVGIIGAAKYGRLGFSIGAVGTSSVGLLILTAIAVPNFIKFQARSKQSECKVNLKMLATAQKSFAAEHDAYSTDATVIGFVPEHGNRYTYRLGTGPNATVPADTKRFPEIDLARLEAALDQQRGAQLGASGHCPDCTFVAACAGNVDGDDEIDLWTIASFDRPGAPAFTPFNDFNDVSGEAGTYGQPP